jgi:hypothetical protein
MPLALDDMVPPAIVESVPEERNGLVEIMLHHHKSNRHQPKGNAHHKNAEPR